MSVYLIQISITNENSIPYNRVFDIVISQSFDLTEVNLIMKRRHFLAGAAGVLAAGSTIGYASLNSKPDNAFNTLAEVKVQLRSLMDALSKNESVEVSRFVSSNNAWTPAQHFVHMAQSIELSINGYPVHRSDTFKSFVGPLAFSVFSSKGASTHNTMELIPGTKPVTPDLPLSQAVNRLIAAIEMFESSDKVQSHFAYGDLTIAEYQNAHLFHINEHWQDLSFA